MDADPAMTPRELAMACAQRHWPEMPRWALESAYGAWLDVKTPPQPSDEEMTKYDLLPEALQAGDSIPFWKFVPEWCEGMLLDHLTITPVGRTGVRVEAISDIGQTIVAAAFGGSPKGVAVRLWRAWHDVPEP